MEDWYMELSICGPFGVRNVVRLPIDTYFAQEHMNIPPPLPELTGFAEGARVLHRRKVRKEVFDDAAGRLGKVLAERMEDAEGWHGAHRIENATLSLEGE